MTETITLSKPTPEQEAYLNSLGAASDGTEDWSVAAAKRHLHYLRLCKNEKEEIDFLAAALRTAESGGALRAAREFGAVVAKVTAERNAVS